VQRVVELVKASRADLGAIIDPDGEHLTLIDGDGHVLSDAEALFAFIRLVSGHLVGNEIAVPVSVSHHVNALAGTHGATVRWTKTATSALMDAARQPEVGFAASADGGFILPGFLPAFDAAAALVKLMELLALEKTSLADVVSDLPRPHVIHETVVTPWDRKGLVMRSLVEQTKDLRVELIDGVKVWHDQDWILALPDVTEPVTHLWAEGATEADARRLAEEYARRIRQLVR
jgi:mannose-1-phosphate guanylyltransferase/phosphomannomutase